MGAGAGQRLAPRRRGSHAVHLQIGVDEARGVNIGRMSITLKVNGRSHTVDVDPATPLLYVLSDDLELNGPKFGCGLGQCGSCAVIIKGEAVRSCVTPVGTLNRAD